eukprot:scaffold88174_cov57-Attheya_sp.AAC.6
MSDPLNTGDAASLHGSTLEHLSTCQVKEEKPKDSVATQVTDVFPASRIKAQLLKDEGVGKLSAGAVRLIGACSAQFILDLATNAASASLASNAKASCSESKGGAVSSSRAHNILTKEDLCKHISAHVEKYDFLEEVVKQTQTESTPNSYGIKSGAKRKRTSSGITAKNGKDKIKKLGLIAEKDGDLLNESRTKGKSPDGYEPSQLISVLRADAPLKRVKGKTNSDLPPQELDDEALKEAVKDAASANLGGIREIIEDEDNYD